MAYAQDLCRYHLLLPRLGVGVVIYLLYDEGS